MNHPYYDHLNDLKSGNKLFEFNEITNEQLKKLWFEESAPDSVIADLFGVTKYQVTKKRKDMNLNTKDCIWESVMQKMKEHKATILE